MIEIEDEIGEAASTGIVTTGDLRLEGKIEGHVCKMYRPSELTSLVERAGGAVLSMSSSNWASLGDEDALAELESDHGRWSRFLALETEACREPGIVGAGTHILFATKAVA